MLWTSPILEPSGRGTNKARDKVKRKTGNYHDGAPIPWRQANNIGDTLAAA